VQLNIIKFRVILFFTWYAQNKPSKNTHNKQHYRYKNPTTEPFVAQKKWNHNMVRTRLEQKT